MAQYRIHDPEELLECPYDKVHMVRAKRFQYHLMKCRKNYSGREFSSCPFNAKHELPKPEMRHHLTLCPDRAVIEPELSYAQRKASDQDLQMKGCTDTPVYREIEIESSEDWDAELGPPVLIGPMHDPSYHSRVVFKDLSSMNKPQKAVMMDKRLTPEQKMSELQALQTSRKFTSNGHQTELGNDLGEGEEGLRLPKTASITALQPKPRPVEQPVSSVFAYSVGRGQGRGQPKTNGATGRGQMQAQMAWGRGQPQMQGATGRGQQQEQGAMGREQPEDLGALTQGQPQLQGAWGRGQPQLQGAWGKGPLGGVGRGEVPLEAFAANFENGGGIGRSMTPGTGRGIIAPPPGFCVPNINMKTRQSSGNGMYIGNSVEGQFEN